MHCLHIYHCLLFYFDVAITFRKLRTTQSWVAITTRFYWVTLPTHLLEITATAMTEKLHDITCASKRNDDTAECLPLLQKFQRDINRMNDTDRNTRKRGLQKLLDDLPWKSKKERRLLESLIISNVLLPLISGISDPVEKCRELCIALLSSSMSVLQPLSLNSEMLMAVIRGLCNRINDIPFAETSEELRLQILELIKVIMRHSAFSIHFEINPGEVADIILTTITKALLDTFPAAKRSCAEIISMVSAYSPISVRMCFKTLLKSLIGNATHQHSKTRSATLQVYN